MKVNQTGPGSSVERSRKTSKTSSASDSDAFRRQIEDEGTEAAFGPSGSAPLAALSSLLSVQEVPDPTSGRRRAVLHGDTLLDELKALQVGLIQGWVSEDTLRTLAHMVDRPRPPIDDPALNEVLDEIELRAAVELAKLERRPSPDGS